MKKVLFAAACAIIMAGCADVPQSDVPHGFKEETYTVTGSRIARKANDRSGVAVMSKDQLENQMSQQGVNNGVGK